MRGKLVVIEGIDGSGKATQTELLVNKLEASGFGVKTSDFPRYETSFWGRHVGRMLAKDYGNPMEVSPYLTALPYMLDQADGSKKQIVPWLMAGKMVVSNRYFTSNVHQIAKMKDEMREEYAKWLWQAGYDELGIVKPDLVIVLMVEAKICRENVIKKVERKYTKGAIMDAAEEDYGHQMKAAVEYKKMVLENPGWWTLVECCDEGGLMSPEEISKQIWSRLLEFKIV